MADLTLNAVRKTYPGGVEAVKGVSLAIPDGAMCVLVGPSGCGKSTLLRMIAGLETITAGTVAIGNRIVNDEEPADRDIAMVFQNYALYPHMSVYDNMAYGLKNRGTPKDEIARRVAEAAKILAIEPYLKRKPRELSGGQRQRVAMGRAIVRKPAVFLFDEPLSNLDAKLRVTMRVEIKRLQRAVGVTSVYVTHDQLEAMTLADVLVVMNQGETEQIGTPLDIYERPATTFVAGFIGAPPMNLLGVTPDAGGRPLLGEGRGLAGAEAIRLPAGGGTLGVRPEHLTLVGEPTLPEGGAGFDLAVTAVEQVGAESYVYGRLADGPEMIVRVPGKHTPAVGETIRAIAPHEYLHVFDGGGRRAA